MWHGAAEPAMLVMKYSHTSWYDGSCTGSLTWQACKCCTTPFAACSRKGTAGSSISGVCSSPCLLPATSSLQSTHERVGCITLLCSASHCCVVSLGLICQLSACSFSCLLAMESSVRPYTCNGEVHAFWDLQQACWDVDLLFKCRLPRRDTCAGGGSAA